MIYFLIFAFLFFLRDILHNESLREAVNIIGAIVFAVAIAMQIFH